jgi:hypothetical protein
MRVEAPPSEKEVMVASGWGGPHRPSSVWAPGRNCGWAETCLQNKNNEGQECMVWCGFFIGNLANILLASGQNG